MGRVGTREAFPGTDTPVAVVVYVRDSGITAADARARPVRDPAAPTAELSRV